MWWIFQIIAIICVTAALTFGRWYGLNYPGQGIFTPWAVKVGIEFIAAYAFIKSFTILSLARPSPNGLIHDLFEILLILSI